MKSVEDNHCTWKLDTDCIWHSSCGEMHVFMVDSDFRRHNYRYCPFCGKLIKEG
jgi:hypothetical protein